MLAATDAHWPWWRGSRWGRKWLWNAPWPRLLSWIWIGTTLRCEVDKESWRRVPNAREWIGWALWNLFQLWVIGQREWEKFNQTLHFLPNLLYCISKQKWLRYLLIFASPFFNFRTWNSFLKIHVVGCRCDHRWASKWRLFKKSRGGGGVCIFI